MSKHTTTKIIKKELSHLNATIDMKIIKGISYSREARHHKFLLSQLSILEMPKKSFYSRMSSMISSVVL